MTDFRMHQTVNDLALHHRAAANAGADGEVDGVGKILRRTPTRFTQ